MKKIISILLLTSMLFLLISCKNEEETMKIGVLSGSTGLGAAKMYYDTKDEEEGKFKITYYQTSELQKMQADIASGVIDAAAMATSDAALYYNSDYQKSAPISVIALNTSSVLYIVSKNSEIKTLDDLKDKTVYLPTPEGQSPDVIFRTLLSKNAINNVKIENQSSPQALLQLVLSGKAEIALMPEPLTTQAKAKAAATGLTLYRNFNIGDYWGSDSQIVQGCIIARNDFIKSNSNKVRDFLTEYTQSIDYMSNSKNLDSAAKIISEIEELNMNETTAKAALPTSGLIIIKGSQMKQTLSKYLEDIFETNSSSIGGKLPESSFYYE